MTTTLLRGSFRRLVNTPSFRCHPQHERHYTVAITRDVPQSFADALSSDADPNKPPISVAAAREQHRAYVACLRTVLPTIALPTSEDHPDCVFTEDSAVVVGNAAVVNRIGAPTRVGEVDAVRSSLLQLGLSVTDMAAVQEGATCDGGDVLHPVTSLARGDRRGPTMTKGRHLFVGLSGRTNDLGVSVLDRVFGRGGVGVEVVPVPDIDGTGFLHLKSIVTHVDERTLLAPVGPVGDEILLAMKASERGYEAIRLPDASACNVVSVNGVILAPLTECEETRVIFEKEMKGRGYQIEYLRNDEIAKCDGALTCGSILLDV